MAQWLLVVGKEVSLNQNFLPTVESEHSKPQPPIVNNMRNLKYWVPPLLYMILIFAISSMEQPPLPMPEFEWLTIDKLYHFIEYAILGGLLARAFVGAKPAIIPSQLVWHIAALLSILYGASDEWHQTFVPGRFATLADWVADVLGSIAGVFGVYLYYKKKQS